MKILNFNLLIPSGSKIHKLVEHITHYGWTQLEILYNGGSCSVKASYWQNR